MPDLDASCYRQTTRSDDFAFRVWCGICLSIASALLIASLRGGPESPPLVVPAFFGAIGLWFLIEITRAREFEFVVDAQCIRWGPTTGKQRAISRHSVLELFFNAGPDHDLASAHLRNGARENLPTGIIGGNHTELAHAVAKLWPEVTVYLGIDIVYVEKK